MCIQSKKDKNEIEAATRAHYNQFNSHEQAGCVFLLPPFVDNNMEMKIANAGHYTHNTWCNWRHTQLVNEQECCRMVLTLHGGAVIQQPGRFRNSCS